MATLNNTRISDTYFGLIKTIDNAVISATLKELTDGSGNQTGLYINNAGDFKVNSVLEFGSLKDTGENITITKFVDAADGIGNNNNDTTIPTSAAIVSYVAAQITAEDLDFTGDDASVAGDVDLNSEQFRILGTTNEIETSVVSAGGNQLRVGIVTNPTLSGNVAITGNIDFSDNAKARFGASQDLQIYHDGANSFINETGTGNLRIYTNDLEIKSNGGTETLATFATNGAVSLYYDDSLKLATSSSGLSVTGKISNLTDPTANQDAATKAYVDSLDAGSDLDFSGDSGTGDVNLNAQTFAVTGTSNQIITSASNQTLNLSLPSTVHRNLQGNVTGDLTGNVTGDVTGNITGTINTGSVIASGVTATTQSAGDNSTKVATTAYVDSLDAASDLDFSDGTNSGAVVLNTQTFSIIGTANEVETSASNQQLQIGLPSSINVNSASATILQTARDISLTGEASATISSFNGSSNVSGAVTLDNNSVTGKVLTGLASPTASNILASDSILQAFGKAQSQINTLAGGLRFMGTWNANTNTPTLTSGGGEADSGTTTGTATNKLIQSGQNFTSTVTNGDKVINQDSGATALVTNVDSNTQLTLDADIMVSGQDYTIDNSPFITQGHYFVVSVGGTSSLNGLSNWAVGDWVIAGAGNVWEKLDHTQVDGTGTAGNITKWSSTNVIADSIMAESGSTITVTGGLTTTQNLLSEGTFTVHGDATIGDNFGDNHTMNGQLIQTSTESIGIKLSRRNGTTGLLVSSSGDSNVHFGTDNGSGSNTHHWTIGKDNSDNAFRISAGSVLGTGDKIKITGSSTTSYQDFVMGGNDIKFADNGHLYLGDSNDLDLYHDSTDSFIINNTGILNIKNNDIRFKTSGDETMLRAVANGAVELMYDNSVVFATKTKGVNIDAGQVLIGEDGTYGGSYGVLAFGGDTNGSNRIFGNTGTADGLFIAAATGRGIFFRVGGGAVDNMTITATADVGIGVSTPYAFDTTATKFHVKNDAGAGSVAEVARFQGSADASGSAAVLRVGTSNDRGMYIQAGRTGAVPYAEIGTTEYDGTKSDSIFLNSDKSVEFKGEISVKSAQDSSFDEGIGVIRSNSTQTGYMNMVGGAFNFNAPSAIPIKFRDGGTTNVTIGGDGKVTFAQNIGIGGDPTQNLDIQKSNARFRMADGTDQINMGLWDGSNYRFEGDSNRPMFLTSYEGNIKMGISGNVSLNVVSGGANVTGTLQATATSATAGYFETGTSIPANQIVHVRDGVAAVATNSAGGIKISSVPGNDVFLLKRNDGATSYFALQNSSASEHITVEMAGGNVGIGGVSSGSKLEIVGGGYNSIRIGSNQTANTNKLSGISMNNYEGNGTSIFQTFCQNNSNAVYYGSADGGFRGIQKHFFMVNADSDATTGHELAMKIDSTGVGINESNPSEKLEITGGYLRFKGGDYGIKGSASLTYNATSDHYFQASGSTKVTFKAGGEVILGTGTNNAGFLDFDSTNLQFNTQRNPNTGAFVDTNKSHAHIGLQGPNGGSAILFGTIDSNNAVAKTRMQITKTGLVQINSDNGSTNQAVFEQTITVHKGLSSAGTAIPIAFVDHTHALDVTVIVKQDTSNVATGVGRSVCAYGSSSTGFDAVTGTGNVTGLTLAYLNTNPSGQDYVLTLNWSGSGASPDAYVTIRGNSTGVLAEY